MQELAKDAEKIKKSLVNAASELFTTTGYNETTVRMITTKAEVDNRSFYYLFGSKEELLETVVEHITDEEVAELTKLGAQIDDPLERLMASVRFMLSCKRSRGLLVNLVEKRSVIINDMFKVNIMEKVCPYLEQLICDGIASGQMHMDEPAQTAKLLLNNVVYVFYYLTTEDDHEKIMKMMVAFIRMTEAALGLKKQASPVTFQKMQDSLREII